MTIQEILSKNNIITETAAAEFYRLDNKYYAVLNGKTTSLDEFMNLTSRDNSYADVADAIKAKMKSMNFSGDIKEFIKKYFKFKNEKLDVFVKNGNNNNIYDKTSIIKRSSYDEKEIETELRKDKKNLNESYSEEAESIADRIIERIDSGPKRTRIFIGDIFNLEQRKAFIKVTSSDKSSIASTTVGTGPFPSYPFVITINPMRNKERFKSYIIHEVVHLLNYMKSKGKNFTYIKKGKDFEKNQIPSKIKNIPSKRDKLWANNTLNYIKNADELDAFYNQLFMFLKGRKFKNSLAIRKALYDISPNITNNFIDYYLKYNKEIKKYFMKRFYKDGIIKSVEDNV